MNRAPQVLVVASYRGEEPADRVAASVARQTYEDIRLVFVRRDGGKVCLDSHAHEICGEAELTAKSGADYILFWPESTDLKPAAIEKLILALHLAPDQDGVADVERGSTGLWLARNNEGMKALITLWPGSQVAWITECLARKPSLFFIVENLIESDDANDLCRPYAVEHLFGKLPHRFQNYQSLPIEPVWPLPAGATDDRSVLFLVHNLPMGGACKFILDLAGQLASRGFRITVATTMHNVDNPNPWLEKLLRIVPDVFLLSHSRPIDLPRQIVHLARTRRCGRVVLSHSMLSYQLLPWLRTELPGVAFVDYTHIEYETEWPDGGYALRSVNSQALLDLSLASSNHLRDWMLARGAEPEAVRVCHTNIDTDKWTPSITDRERERREIGLDAKTALILYPCRLAEQKRPELMCNIVAALRRATRVPFVVVVAGDGPLLPALQNFVVQNGLLDSFRLLGAVSLESVARLHNASDIFLLPSLIEGISLALFEAMALESVPVVSDVGGQRELVTPECGHLIPVGEPAHEIPAYVAVLKQLLENPNERRQKATACRARVRDHFPLSKMTTTFIDALDEAGRRHQDRPARLPAVPTCREIVTLAIEQIRLTHEGLLLTQMNSMLKDKTAKQEKIIAKLQRQTAPARPHDLIPEAHGIGR